jgi:hypothetical protein
MRLTRPGAVVLSVLAMCVIVVIVASGPLQAPAVSIGCFLLALIAGKGISGGVGRPDANLGRMGESARKREVLRRYARPRRRAPDGEDAQS